MQTPKATRTFTELISHLDQSDGSMASLSQEDLENLIGDVSTKVDSLADVLTRMKSEQQRLADIANEFTEKKRVIANAEKRLKDYIIFSMKKAKFDKLPGNRYTLSFRKRVTIKPADREIGSETYMDLNARLDGVVKRSYSFDSAKFKELCNDSPDVLEKYGQLLMIEYPQFTVKKGI